MLVPNHAGRGKAFRDEMVIALGNILRGGVHWRGSGDRREQWSNSCCGGERLHLCELSLYWRRLKRVRCSVVLGAGRKGSNPKLISNLTI